MKPAPTLAELTPLLDVLHELAEIHQEMALLVDLGLISEPLRAAAQEGRMEDLLGAEGDYFLHGMLRYLADARDFASTLDAPIQRLSPTWERLYLALDGIRIAQAA